MVAVSWWQPARPLGRIWLMAAAVTCGHERRQGRGFLHARAVSRAWGFADDVLVSVRCAAAGSVAILEAQARARRPAPCFATAGSRRACSACPWAAVTAAPACTGSISCTWHLIFTNAQRAAAWGRRRGYDEQCACACAPIVFQPRDLFGAQSVLRIGLSDFGVNQARLASLWAHVQHEIDGGGLPHAMC